MEHWLFQACTIHLGRSKTVIFIDVLFSSRFLTMMNALWFCKQRMNLAISCHDRFPGMNHRISRISACCRSNKAANELGISCVTICHRPALLEHHHQMLLACASRWTWTYGMCIYVASQDTMTMHTSWMIGNDIVIIVHVQLMMLTRLGKLNNDSFIGSGHLQYTSMFVLGLKFHGLLRLPESQVNEPNQSH